MQTFKSEFIESTLGFVLKNETVIVFFGNKAASLEKIKSTFTDLHFQKIKQTHSDIIVESSNSTPEADAQLTQNINSGLLISTADCLPLMIYCHQTQKVAAIHAGWKGVANQIIFKTIQQLIGAGSTEKKFSIWVGPHILQKSFEVELDVLQQLQNSSYGLAKNELFFEKNNKYFVDLKKIVENQISAALGKRNKISFVDLDTKTNQLFWSFRREKEAAGRNLSFIARLK